MADVKISGLPAATSIGVADLLAIVQSGTTKKATVSLLPLLTGRFVRVDLDNGTSGGARGDWNRPFATITQAIAVAQAGDVIFLGPGTYTENSGIQLPNSVDLIGSGRDVSIIQSSLSLSSNKAILAPGNDSFISDLTVHGTASAVAPFGLGNTQNATGAIIVENCHFYSDSGGSDGIYLNGSASSGSFYFHNVKVLSGGDTIFSISPTLIECHDCELISDGSSASQSNGIKNSSGNPVIVFGGTVSGNDNSVNTSTSPTELYGTKIIPGAAAGYVDLNGSGCKICGVCRSDGLCLVTSGTITELSTSYARCLAVKTTTTDQTSTTETAHLSTPSLPANFCKVGTTFRISAWGDMDVGNNATQITFTPRIRWGGTGGVQLMATPTVIGPASSAQSNRRWKIEAYVTIRTIGATGTAWPVLGLESHIAGTTGAYAADEDSPTAAVTIATNAAKTLDLTWSLSSTNGTPHVRTYGGVIELVKGA